MGQSKTPRKSEWKKKSAGLLVYRQVSGKTEVLLVHPGAPYWARKEDGVWSIPKGEFTDEAPLAAAKREFQEETGFAMTGHYHPLDPVRETTGKLVYAWAVRGDMEAAAIKSNTFSMEWPRGSGNFRDFPEVDRAGWFTLARAKRKLFKGQLPLLDQLRRLLKSYR